MTNTPQKPDNAQELDTLAGVAMEALNAMTTEEQAKHRAEQKASWVRGEQGFKEGTTIMQPRKINTFENATSEELMGIKPSGEYEGTLRKLANAKIVFETGPRALFDECDTAIQALIAERDTAVQLLEDGTRFLKKEHETALNTARNDAIEECAAYCQKRADEYVIMGKSDPLLMHYKSDIGIKAMVWDQASKALRIEGESMSDKIEEQVMKFQSSMCGGQVLIYNEDRIFGTVINGEPAKQIQSALGLGPFEKTYCYAAHQKDGGLLLNVGRECVGQDW